MSQFSSNRDQAASPTPLRTRAETLQHETPRRTPPPASPTEPIQSSNAQITSSDTPARQRERAPSTSRPMSMLQTYQPPLMDVSQDTIPELQPIFTFLNSHQNKLYQEGYFLKLDDQNTRTFLYSPSLAIANKYRGKGERGPNLD